MYIQFKKILGKSFFVFFITTWGFLSKVETTYAQFPFMHTEPQNKKTYLYAWKKRWNNTENVWVKGDNRTQYYTFTNNNCYISDKDGFSVRQYNIIYQYYGKKDGQIYYFYNLAGIKLWIVVSEDYKTLTTIEDFVDQGAVHHYVYEKTDPSSGKNYPNISPQSSSKSNNRFSSIPPNPQIRSSGGNYNSNSNSLKSSSDRYTCGMCNGTGKCKDCGGKGVRWNKYSDTWDACPYCNGANGICKWCSGKGYKTY